MEKTAGERRCVIISAAPTCVCDGIDKDDYIIACDGGLRHADRAGVKPDLTVGDFDSYKGVIPKKNVIRSVPEKDDTDTMLAVKLALEKGFRRFLLLGATGGRLDHTLANIAAVAYITERGGTCELRDECTVITAVKDGAISVKRRQGYSLSVLSFSEISEGVYERGVKYPLTDATLKNSFPLGVSNQIVADEATVSVRKGTLIIVESALEQ